MHPPVATVLLHPGHNTTTASSGIVGPQVQALAVGLVAALGVAAGLYLVLGAVRPDDPEREAAAEDAADE